MPEVISDDLSSLVNALPPRVIEAVNRLEYRADLLEIVLDLGRLPTGRFPEGDVILSQEVVTRGDLAYVVERIGQFGDDNRAGIERTLHRISAIRNRRGEVVGLTCRVGRAIRGAITLIRDVVDEGKSILILGRPGAGKTTLLREAARVLADELGKRVVVVDTSNEIAGDGDIPHPGIGRARRMQVTRTAEQHAVMIEAVENHMPEVIVIDEIGTELEAQAARTIAERGVQLVGTAHGRTLDNLLLNPTLSDLVGGIQVVTLGDEEARRRGTQKTVLERKAPPTFDVLVEQLSWREVTVHRDVAAAVDALLRGQPLIAERRTRDELDQVTARRITVTPSDASVWGGRDREQPPAVEIGSRGRFDGRAGRAGGLGRAGWEPASWAWSAQNSASHASRTLADPRRAPIDEEPAWDEESDDLGSAVSAEALEPTGTSGATGTLTPVGTPRVVTKRRAVRIYPFGISRERLEQAARELRAPVEISHDQRTADAVITLKTFYKRQSGRLTTEPSERKPVYILRTNTVAQMQECLARIFDLKQSDAANGKTGKAESVHPTHETMRETEDAIHHLLNHGLGHVELPPASSHVRRLQHTLAERYNLESRSFGKEPYRRVKIFAR
jgi:stage III sporulation protein SpoIIIAA